MPACCPVQSPPTPAAHDHGPRPPLCHLTADPLPARRARASGRSTARDKCARLLQLAALLNLDAVEDVLDFWGQDAGSHKWQLKAEEVRRVLALRSDFKQADIAALRLV